MGRPNHKILYSYYRKPLENQRFWEYPINFIVYNLAEKEPEANFETWLASKPKREQRLNRLLSKKQVTQIKQYRVNIANWLKNTGEAPALIDQKI